MWCKCGNRLSEEEENEGMCSSCMWAEEMEFLETAYAEDIAERAKAHEAPEEPPF